MLPSPEVERHAALGVALGALALPPALLQALQRLGIVTLGAFLRLSHAEVRQRFGAAAGAIHAAVNATQGPCVPLQPYRVVAPLQAGCDIDPPDGDSERLLFMAKALLQPLLAPAQRRGQSIVALQLKLRCSAKIAHDLHLEPAAPTLELHLLLDLLRLRLQAVRLHGPIEHMQLTLRCGATRTVQGVLQQQRPQRDVRAAAAALAKVRAAFGESATVVARLCDSHLPEHSFVWETCTEVMLPRPRRAAGEAAQKLPLVRQIYTPPRPLSPGRRLWLGAALGTVARLHGPHRIQTHWWAQSVGRDYYYAETDHQHLAWIYFAPAQRRWFVQGLVD